MPNRNRNINNNVETESVSQAVQDTQATQPTQPTQSTQTETTELEESIAKKEAQLKQLELERFDKELDEKLAAFNTEITSTKNPKVPTAKGDTGANPTFEDEPDAKLGAYVRKQEGIE